MHAVAVPASLAAPDAAAAAARIESRALTSVAALESALAEGLSETWRELVESDPLASVYQSAGWCVPWYRAYVDEYDPFVIVVTADTRVVGLVPMAVDRRTRALVFASHTMADYRDIVARSGYRAAVCRELVRSYQVGKFTNPLEVGWIDPASDTPALVAAACRELRLRSAVRHQPCWRWFPAPGEQLSKKFSRVRTHLNHFKRQGDVTFDIVTGRAEWDAFLDEFARQHSLRQLQAGRGVSFDDPRKQVLYTALLDSPDVRMHVTACRLNGRMLSGHVGLVWRGVLMLGAPSISLEDEQRSPALILMSWIMQNAESLDLKGFDLTIGESEFKRRLGNQCVQLTMVEVHARAAQYHARTARAHAVAIARRAVDRVAGEGTWTSKVKPAAAAFQHKRRRFSEMGPLAAIGKAISAVPGGETREVVLSAAAGDVALPDAGIGDAIEIHDNRVEDLLLWRGQSAATEAALTSCARTYGRSRSTNHTLHTLVDNGALAAWCYSVRDEDAAGSRAIISEIGATPQFADRGAAEMLVRRIAARSFASGASHVRVLLAADQRILRSALGAAGFRIEGHD